MDPHSTPTSVYETEVEAERARGWVPAFLTALFTTGGLWALQYFSDTAPLSTWADKSAAASSDPVATLLGGHLTYFGSDSGSQLTHTAVVTATVFVVSYIASWLGTIGIWPRAWWPVLLGSWFAVTLGAALGLVAGQVELYVGHGHEGLAIAHVDDVIERGGAYGLIWGLPIAFVVSLLWLAVPGKGDDLPMASAGQPEFFGGSSTHPGALQSNAAQVVPVSATATMAVPTSRPALPAGPSAAQAPVTQPVRVRTFTAPVRGNGAADDTAAWKAFVKDVRGRS